MLRAWPALVLALFHPDPVTGIGIDFNGGGSLTLSWTLPADPGVVGLTIYRDNLDDGDTTIFQIVGLTDRYTDTGADPDDSYRYWIHTRDAQGDLSDGVYVEVFAEGGHGHWACSASSSGLPAPWMVGAGVLLGLLALRRR